MTDVVYRVDLSSREQNGQFKREVVAEITADHNPYLVVAYWRMNNGNPNFRYILGHVK